MNALPKLDGRLAKQLEAELQRTAIALRGEDAGAMPVGEIERAIYAVAARIGEEVTTRLDKAPGKQADNFYEATGLGRDAARAAALPVAFKLTETFLQSLSAPAGSQLLANADEPVIFETQTSIDLVPGRIETVRGVDAEQDVVTMPPAAMLSPVLPLQTPSPRRLKALAGAGDLKMQLNPVSGLKEGALLALGSGTQAQHYRLTKIEGDVITVEPPLETAFLENTLVTEVVCFAPFGGSTRDHQQHNLYLAHSTLLDTPSAVSLSIGGASLPQGAEWQWWGSESDGEPPAWHKLDPQPGGDDFSKPKGKPQKTKINGQENFWIRATLNGKSSGAERAKSVTLAIVGKDCELSSKTDGECEIHNPVGYDAVAANIPAIVNKPYHPFGREPRLYDAFYVGSKEAFPKIGAKVAMSFAFGGASLGPMAAVADGDALEVFGVGSDGLLYRARVAESGGTILQVSREGKDALKKQARVALSAIGRSLFVAVAGERRIDVAALGIGGPLTPDQVQWTSIALPSDADPEIVEIAAQIRDGKLGFVVHAGKRLFRCPVKGEVSEITFPLSEGNNPSLEGKLLPVEKLVTIKGTNTLIAVTEDSSPSDPRQLHRIGSAKGDDLDFEFKGQDGVPLKELSGWSSADLSAPVYLAGFDEQHKKLRLLAINSDASALSDPLLDEEDEDIEKPLSLCLVGPVGGEDLPPSLIFSRLDPLLGIQFEWAMPVGERYVRIPDSGVNSAAKSENGMIVATDRWLATQQDDVGMMVRRLSDSTGMIRYSVAIDGHEIALREHRELPNEVFAVARDANSATFQFFAFDARNASNPMRLARLFPQATNSLTTNGDSSPYADKAELLTFKNATLYDVKVKTAPTDHWQLKDAGGEFLKWASLDDQVFLRIPPDLTTVGDIGSIVGLEPLKPEPGNDAQKNRRWTIPQGFSGSTGPTECRVLEIQGATNMPLFDAFPFDIITPESYAQMLGQNTLRPLLRPDYVLRAAVSHADSAFFLAPKGSIVDDRLQMIAAPPSWLRIGPDAPANPALSWEYWNGSSWWALDAGNFSDGTGHFQTNGCVRFTVPLDIKPTDVSGKPGHWIRARLVGGDYGEARFSVITTPDGSGGSKQETKRDTSAIRAPYIVNLDIGYCASDPVRPEIIYAEDSLSFVDQTSANEADLPFDFFVPLSRTMNPPDIEREAAKIAAEEGNCNDPCPEDEAAQPDLCDEPGAYDRCDSPCIWTPGDPRPKTEAASGFVRGVMLGFDKRFSGNTISIYVMAEPTGSPVNLKADISADGGFRRVRVVSDSSYGLTEPGLLTLAIPKAPDESNLLGETSHWLRLWPDDPSNWSPRICGMFLNGALTRSVETRSMERLGASNGTAAQLFQLAEAPVDPETLRLRVREILGQQEREGLDIITYPNGPPGEWVLWKVASDFSGDGEPARNFTLDASAGTLRFGDGNNGLIPPLGAELLAERYARVKGSVANKVKAGTKPTLLASLVGVDSVLTLDYAAGGSDTEPPLQARRRASAKLRHGDRILTISDLADFVPTLAPDIAQVRVIASARTTKVVVALTGPEPRPMPAKLRGIKRNIESVSGYGLRRPDGLEIVGPRLLPFGLAIELDPLSADSFADAVEEAKQCLIAFFDVATGGHDGCGWPIGELPKEQDIAAALMPIADLAFTAAIALRRTDRATGFGDALPGSIPKDVLVRFDLAGLHFERVAEVTV